MGDPMDSIHSQIIERMKASGVFDQFRKECIADVDTKPAYINLHGRVVKSCNDYLKSIPWSSKLLRISIRDGMRKQIVDSTYFEKGVDRIVTQAVDPKVNTAFFPIVENAVYEFLGLQKPKPGEVQEETEEDKKCWEQPMDIDLDSTDGASQDIKPVVNDEMMQSSSFKLEASVLDSSQVKLEVKEEDTRVSATSENELIIAEEQTATEDVDEAEEDDEEESPPFEAIGLTSPPYPVTGTQGPHTPSPPPPPMEPLEEKSPVANFSEIFPKPEDRGKDSQHDSPVFEENVKVENEKHEKTKSTSSSKDRGSSTSHKKSSSSSSDKPGSSSSKDKGSNSSHSSNHKSSKSSHRERDHSNSRDKDRSYSDKDRSKNSDRDKSRKESSSSSKHSSSKTSESKHSSSTSSRHSSSSRRHSSESRVKDSSRSSHSEKSKASEEKVSSSGNSRQKDSKGSSSGSHRDSTRSHSSSSKEHEKHKSSSSSSRKSSSSRTSESDQKYNKSSKSSRDDKDRIDSHRSGSSRSSTSRKEKMETEDRVGAVGETFHFKPPSPVINSQSSPQDQGSPDVNEAGLQTSSHHHMDESNVCLRDHEETARDKWYTSGNGDPLDVSRSPDNQRPYVMHLPPLDSVSQGGNSVNPQEPMEGVFSDLYEDNSNSYQLSPSHMPKTPPEPYHSGENSQSSLQIVVENSDSNSMRNLSNEEVKEKLKSRRELAQSLYSLGRTEDFVQRRDYLSQFGDTFYNEKDVPVSPVNYGGLPSSRISLTVDQCLISDDMLDLLTENGATVHFH